MTAGRSSPSPHHIELRKLPSVDKLLRTPELTLLAAEFGQAAVTDAARAALDRVRSAVAGGAGAPAGSAWPLLVQEQLEAAGPSLQPVINATGIIVHTNLGRAPLSAAAVAAVQAAAGYTNLEYDLVAGARGSRHDHARRALCALTGAEDALIVNNNAAAVYLALTACCQGREVLISRGQLVEIGGGFRIPDVLRQSGAHLVEVGATNRTHPFDFQQAVTPATAAIMRVHSSNFRQIGFVAMPSLADLAAIAHAHGLLLIDDLGSGTLLDTAVYGLAAEPLVQESVAAGADLITFSGDKLLGGPQAGIVLGRRELVDRLRRHPMARAVRPDKLTLAALEATLQSYRRGRATVDLPVWQMIAAAEADLAERARHWRARLVEQGIAATVQAGESAVGGGSLPGETLPTHLLAVACTQPAARAAALRRQSPPVICRIHADLLLFDPRTVAIDQEEALLTSVVKVCTLAE